MNALPQSPIDVVDVCRCGRRRRLRIVDFIVDFYAIVRNILLRKLNGKKKLHVRKLVETHLKSSLSSSRHR